MCSVIPEYRDDRKAFEETKELYLIEKDLVQLKLHTFDLLLLFTKTRFQSRRRKEIQHFFHRTEMCSVIPEYRDDSEAFEDTKELYLIEKDLVQLKLHSLIFYSSQI